MLVDEVKNDRVERETGRGGEFIGERANARDCKSDRSVAGSTQATRVVCLKRSDGWGQDGLRRRKINKWHKVGQGPDGRIFKWSKSLAQHF